MEGLLKIRYPPYRGKLSQYKKMQDLSPNFDRMGRVRIGFVRWILQLGAKSTSGALLRYILIALSKFCAGRLCA
jgi:beta-apo-4'-carotenal oxygenase